MHWRHALPPCLQSPLAAAVLLARMAHQLQKRAPSPHFFPARLRRDVTQGRIAVALAGGAGRQGISCAALRPVNDIDLFRSVLFCLNVFFLCAAVPPRAGSG